MEAFVVDVNVAIVANAHRSPQADQACVLACIKALEDIHHQGLIVLDKGMLILSEYMRNLNMRGQPGLGDAFIQWVWENQAVVERCERVTLTPMEGDPYNFLEFPGDPSLSRFDPSDRKYVATALSSHHNPAVLNAVDTDWWDFNSALQANGVQVTFLCPQCMR